MNAHIRTCKSVIQWRCSWSSAQLLPERHEWHADNTSSHCSCECTSQGIIHRVGGTRRLGLDAILTSARGNLGPSGSRKSYRDRDFVVRILAPWYLCIPIARHNVWGQDICAIRWRFDHQYRVSQFSIVSVPCPREPRVAWPAGAAPA